MKKIFNLFLFAIIPALLFSPGAAGAAGLCKEKVGQDYVNVLLMNDVFGAGLDDVFDVVIRRVRPKTQGELDKLKAFYYFEGRNELGYNYEDGREYKWQLEHNEYRLYKFVKGREPQRLEVFRVGFPTTKKFLYQLRLLKANPRLYKELGLDKKLDALGLMGVVFRGGRGALDFINSVNLTGGTDTPKVVVKNANTVLYRYALASGFEGATTEVTYDEYHGSSGFKILMERRGEQEILDNYYGELLSAASEKDDRYSIVNTVAGKTSTTNINGIKESEIKYIYVPCRAEGKDTYGSPKAAFVPVKIADDKGASFYPVFVFPAAFGGLEYLDKSLRRELYHARWWNAAANLQDSPLREAFMRQAAPQMELDIFEKQRSDPKYSEFQELYASMRLLLHDELRSVTEHPEKLQYDFPWTVSAAFVKATGMFVSGGPDMLDDIGARWYNKAFAQVYPTMDDFSMLTHDLDAKTKKKLMDSLLSALTYGYSLSKEKRTGLLGGVISRPLYSGYFEGMDPYKPGWKWAENQEQAFALMDAVRTKGYGSGDLEWTGKLVKAFGFENDPLGKRFAYLTGTAKVTEITGLDTIAAKPFFISADGEVADVKALLASLKDKGGKALQKVVNDTAMQADKKAAKQKEIQDLNDKVAGLQSRLDQTGSDYDKALKAYKDALNSYISKTDAAYKAMTDQCVNSSNYRPRKDLEAARIYNTYLLVLGIKSAGCGTAVDSFVKTRDNSETEKDLETLYNAQDAKSVEYDKLREEIDAAEALLGQAVMSSETVDKNVASGLEQVNKSKKRRFKTWGDYSREALRAYFSGEGASDQEAFAALEGKLKLINGVSIVKGGVQ